METATQTLKPARSGPPRDLPAIDYLRGLAALGVVVFHARVALWVGWREIQAQPQNFSALDRAAAWLSLPAPFLGALVMLFFVVSGFCVHLPQARVRDKLEPRAYVARRFFRIYPPYFAALVVSALVAATWSGEPVLASVFMAQNYTTGHQISTNPALWSLPVELELYLVYPLVWWLSRRAGWGVALGATGLVSLLAATLVARGQGWLDGNFALYWIIWSGGAWLAEAWTREQLGRPPLWLAAIACAGLGVGVFNVWRQRSGGATNLAWGLFFFWLVWGLIARPEWSAKIPAVLDRALRGLGQISYSLYLIHFPVLLLLGAAWVKFAGGKPHNFLVPLVASAAMVPVAWVFYRAIERPSHELAKRLARAIAR